MIFFTGIHIVNKAYYLDNSCISINCLRNRKSSFKVNNWILDSGAFSILFRKGKYTETPFEYANQIKRLSINGNLLAAVSQDYMCEPMILSKTGLSVNNHQQLTIERYDKLRSYDCNSIYILPVLQGWYPKDYSNHIIMYNSRLKENMWVGVGSICKRNSNEQQIIDVLGEIKTIRSDLRLHGFGLKITALKNSFIREMLYSADSMAWSFAARREGRNANDINEAIAFENKLFNKIKQDEQDFREGFFS